MARPPAPDTEFEIAFFESVLRRNPSYGDVIEILGGLYTRHGRIADGLRMDRRMVRLEPDNSTAHYNLACSLALCRRRADALRSLRRAVDLGYKDAAWMLKDEDLRELRDDPEFTRLVAEVKGRAGPRTGAA
jgi:tetratricopeptide (TPR) repeat protein